MRKKQPWLIGIVLVGGLAAGYAAATFNGSLASPSAAAPAVEIASNSAPLGDESPKQQPNIVYLMADNLGYGELGCYGGGVLRGAATPRIDMLATEGFRLLNYNVEAQCTPSRSALMTGRFAI